MIPVNPHPLDAIAAGEELLVRTYDSDAADRPELQDSFVVLLGVG